MHNPDAKWSFHRIGDVVCIVDMGGAMSAVDCIEDIVGDLRNGGDLLGIRRCICCDSEGMWQQALLSDTQEFLGFAAARTNSLCTALLLVGIETLPVTTRSHIG
ncbi:hypothetical protein PQQ52_22830 [Paraburkholderia sediminicola]|uniref:hypothetical protein n=1 Tax=Paraburkholderia sediminicola TaxID=458836 RepID=UPI0038BD4A49